MFSTLQRRLARHFSSTRALGLAGLTVLTAWLTACGPGVGGTGTGETNGLNHFGATAASVCAADVGAVLGCVTTSGATSPSPTTAATPVFLADAIASPRVQARVQDHAIDLTVACTGLRFRGQWGELAGQGGRFFGFTGPDGAQLPATLQVQAGTAGAAGVVVTLRDASGAVLLGPAALLVVPAALAAGSCG
jgi:hypothetical protein